MLSMSADAILQKRIKELEEEVSQKNREIVRYREELQKANSVIEKMIADLSVELRLASQIQKMLSPTELPHIQGFEFSTKFVPGYLSGGDYFDIFELEDRMRFGVLLACSSGYAMSALFLSVLMKLSGQIEARKGLDPDKVISLLATEVLPQIQGKDSASLFYALIDRRTFELRYSSVGEIAACLNIHGSPNLSWLEPSAPQLTAQFSGRPLTQTIQLGPRDSLVLCTEGVLKAKNESDETFGRERLQKTISQHLKSAKDTNVHDLRNEILYQVEKFIGSSEPKRDQTVIVTEVKDRVIKLAKKS